MPNVSLTSGAVIILGSRSILPNQASDFSLVKPLIVDIGSGTLATYSVTQVSTILNNQTVTTAGSFLADTSQLHSLNLEIAFITSGSIQFSLTGFQPIAKIATSTLLATDWLSSSVIAGVTMSLPSAVTAISNNTLINWNVGTVNATNVSVVLTQYL